MRFLSKTFHDPCTIVCACLYEIWADSGSPALD